MSRRSWKDIKTSIDQKLEPEEVKKMNTHVEISKIIIKNRLEKGWTQAELGQRAGLHQVQIARIENGEQMPTLKTLEKVAFALNMRITLESIYEDLETEAYPEHLDVFSGNVLVSQDEELYCDLEISKVISFNDFKEWANDHVLDCDICQDLIASIKEVDKEDYYDDLESYTDSVSLSDEMIDTIVSGLSAENNIQVVCMNEKLNLTKLKNNLYKIDDLVLIDFLDSFREEDTQDYIEADGKVIYFNQFNKITDDQIDYLAATASDKKSVDQEQETELRKRFEFVAESGEKYNVLVNNDSDLFIEIE